MLEVKSNYREWITRRFDDIETVENREYQAVEISTPSGQTKKNHLIKLNTAKEMAMLERNEKQVRRYFIAVEEKYKEVVQAGITHNVKQLTITSREMAKIDGKLHSWVLQGIRERMADLQEISFDTSQLYMESSYVTKANNTAQQYLCTEQGCEDFSRCLEPDARKVFIQEFPDRFERMRNVLDGKPVKKLPKLICLADVEEKDPLIRLFKTDTGGIVLINDEVHSLTQDEIEQLSRFVPELEKYEIGKTQYIVSAFLRSRKKSGKLEEIASWGVKEKGQAKELLPDKAMQKPKRRLQTDKSIDLNNIENLTELQAKTRYNVGNSRIREISDEIEAVVRVGVKRLYSRRDLDDYFKRKTE